MKRERILLSTIAATVILGSVAWSRPVCPIVIDDDKNTTQYYRIDCDLNVTKNGTVTIDGNDPNNSYPAIASGDGKGIANNQLILNDGNLTVTGTGTVLAGIGNADVNNGGALLENNGTIHNGGRILVDGDANTTVGVVNGPNHGTILNGGQIEIRNQGIKNSDNDPATYEAEAYGIYSTDNSGKIHNDGSVDITMESDDSDRELSKAHAAAIYVESNDGDILDSGSIRLSGKSDVSGDIGAVTELYGIAVDGNNSGDIIHNTNGNAMELSGISTSGEESDAGSTSAAIYVGGDNTGRIDSVDPITVSDRAYSGLDASAESKGIAIEGDNNGSIRSIGELVVSSLADGDNSSDASSVGIEVRGNNSGRIQASDLNVTAVASGPSSDAKSVGVAADAGDLSIHDMSVEAHAQNGDVTAIGLGTSYGDGGNLSVSNVRISASGGEARAFGILDQRGYDGTLKNVILGDIDAESEGNVSSVAGVFGNDDYDNPHVYVENLDVTEGSHLSALAKGGDDDTFASGIALQGVGTLSNRGSIVIDANGSGQVWGVGIAAGYWFDDNGIVTDSLMNDGNISVIGRSGKSNAYVEGIWIDKSADSETKIVNDGRIYTLAEGNGSNSWSIGMLVFSNEGRVENTGEIETEGKNSRVGLPFYIDANTGVVVNSGILRLQERHDSDFEIGYGLYNIGLTVWENVGTVSTTADSRIEVDSNGGHSLVSGVYIGKNDGNASFAGAMDVHSSGSENRSFGIYVENDNSGRIENSSKIRLNADGNESAAIGMSISGENGENGLFQNDAGGTIDVEASTNVSDGRIYAEGIEVWENKGTIRNEGTITATATSLAGEANAYGLYASSDNYGIVTNRGSLQAAADGNSSATAVGIDVDSSNDGSVTNIAGASIDVSATADSGSGSAIASGIRLDNNNSGTLTNNGTITVNASGNDLNATGIGVLGTNTGTLANSGSISVSVTGGNGAAESAALYVKTNDAAITNSGVLSATATGNHAKAYSLYIGSGSANSVFHNTATGVMHGSIKAPDTNVSNDGKLYLGFESSTAGNFVQSDNATLGFKVKEENGAIIRNSLLKVTGDATFEDGSHLFVDVSGDNSVLAADTNITVVTAQGSLDVNASTLDVTDNSALLSFEALVDDNDLLLDVTQSRSIEEAVRASGFSGSGDAGRALDEIADSGNTAMSAMLGDLYGLPTDEAVGRAVASETPQITAFTGQASTQVLGAVQGFIGQRLGSLNQGGGLNAGGDILPAQETLAGAQLWIKPYGTHAEQDPKGGIDGFKMNLRGLGIGADKEWGEASSFGLAFFYSNADLDMKNLDQSEDLDLYTLMAYGSTRFLLNRPTWFLWQAGSTWEKADTHRTEWPSGDGYDGSFNGYALNLDARLVQEYRLNASWSTQLSLFGQYTHFHSDGYTESGPNPANALTVESSSTDRFVLGAGAHFDYAMSSNSHLLLGGDLGYNFGDDYQVLTSVWGGAPSTPFHTRGIDNGGFTYSANLGYKYETDNFDFGIGYRYEGEGSKFDAHSVAAKFTYKF